VHGVVHGLVRHRIPLVVVDDGGLEEPEEVALLLDHQGLML
jgi:hypothetical protein